MTLHHEFQSCVKTFLPSSENHPKNVPLPTPNMHYGTICQPAIPRTWQECFYTIRYIHTYSSAWRLNPLCKKSCRRLFLPPCKNIPIHCRPLMWPWFLGRGPQENWQCNRIVHNSWSDMRAALLEHKMWSMLHLSGDYCMYNLFVQSGAAYRSWGFEGENLGSSPGWWAGTVAT